MGAFDLYMTGIISSQDPDHCNAILCLQLSSKIVAQEMKLGL